MLSEGDRIKTLRKTLNIKQGDFADKISTTQGHISDIENGRKNLSDRTIKLICLESWNGKMVNENWLRTGTGEMFMNLSRDEEIASFIGTILKNEESTFKKKFIKMLASLSETEWEFLELKAKELVDRDE